MIDLRSFAIYYHAPYTLRRYLCTIQCDARSHVDDAPAILAAARALSIPLPQHDIVLQQTSLISKSGFDFPHQP